MKTYRLISNFILVILCGCIIVLFSGCGLFDFSDGIGAVRDRVEKLRYEMSETIVEAIKNDDVSAVKNLLCKKSQEIENIDEQIENTFSFMEGDIAEYKISKSTGYEGYSNDYGKVTQYAFGSDVYITTDAGRKYDLYFGVNYIELDSVIEGITSYSVSENDREYEERKHCRAGFGWSSPYDAECGVISAKLIKAVADEDAAAVKSLLCEQTLDSPKLDGEIQAVFDFFDGAPLFEEREDGLYGSSENDFYCNTIGYEIDRDEDGNAVSVWVSVYAHSIYTDTGKDYRLDFAAYLKCEEKPQFEGISFFSFEDYETEEEKQVGGWIHE